MSQWIPIEQPPARPGSYWTCTIVRGDPGRNGVLVVRYCGGEWREWNGQSWVGQDLPTHWYGEVQS